MISIEKGNTIAGRYRLERALARGGMGAVWVGRHLQLDTDVAIKFMAPEYAASGDARARFEREAKVSAQLKSPNAVHVYDYGIEENTPFLVMELLEGEDLEARLRRELRLTPAVTAHLLTQVCKALHRAHEAGLVHRDIKPGNLFLARHADEEVVKVLDFGIAKSVGPLLVGNATKTGALVGSPHFMSPEQIRTGKGLDGRSDLWSLGVVAFRCMTGRLPFPGDDLGEVLVAICADPIPVASQLAPGLGPEVDAFFHRALARDPGQRFQSARAFAQALSALVGSAGERLYGDQSFREPLYGDRPSREPLYGDRPSSERLYGDRLSVEDLRSAPTLEVADSGLGPVATEIALSAQPFVATPSPAADSGARERSASAAVSGVRGSVAPPDAASPPRSTRGSQVSSRRSLVLPLLLGALVLGLGLLGFTLSRSSANDPNPTEPPAPTVSAPATHAAEALGTQVAPSSTADDVLTGAPAGAGDRSGNPMPEGPGARPPAVVPVARLAPPTPSTAVSAAAAISARPPGPTAKGAQEPPKTTTSPLSTTKAYDPLDER